MLREGGPGGRVGRNKGWKTPGVSVCLQRRVCEGQWGKGGLQTSRTLPQLEEGGPQQGLSPSGVSFPALRLVLVINSEAARLALGSAPRNPTHPNPSTILS